MYLYLAYLSISLIHYTADVIWVISTFEGIKKNNATMNFHELGHLNTQF
jgi:hypothetical protein